MNILINNLLQDPAFFFLSTLSIATALGVILEKNLVRAGLLLVISFGTIAGNYFALKAPFVGASQILIYAVGITLVIVFALMLTSQRIDLPKLPGESAKHLSCSSIALALFALLSFTLTGNKWSFNNFPICPKNTEIIGLKMLGTYTLPFELISVLLLVAIIGAVVIAKKDKTTGGE